MSRRILIGGLCPLPFENTRMSYGPGIRTWQFARSLANAGFEVDLIAMAIPNVYCEPRLEEWVSESGVKILRTSQARFMNPSVFSAWLEDRQPDIVVGATVYGSFALAQIEPTVPFWADQFGHVMAEAQAKAAIDGSDAILEYFWRIASLVSSKGDRFSSVSEPQKWALVGELGALGRLNRSTCGEDLVSTIPCAVIPNRSQIQGIDTLRGDRCPADAFLVLWSGGYNVWGDVETLFHGLSLAMEECPRLHFVSTGGGIQGHDESTYASFIERVEASQHRSRFHLEGWVDAELVPSYTATCDLGILTEKLMYEGQLGSKNRILQWMGGGLPVVYNRVGEIGELLHDLEIGLTFDCGDAEQLAAQILWAADRPTELSQIAQRASSYVDEHLTFEATTRPLVRWAKEPTFAGDRWSRGEAPQLRLEQVPETDTANEVAVGEESGVSRPGNRSILSFARRLLSRG